MALSSETESPPKKKIESITTQSLQSPIAVFSDEYYSKVNLVDVIIGQIKGQTLISEVIQRLKIYFPIPKVLNHLKRVRGNKIILCLAGEKTEEEVLNTIKEDLENLLEPMVHYIKVAAEPIRTKYQHAEANVYWPCIFHPCKTTEQMLNNTFFSTDDIVKQYKFMQMAVNVANEKASPVAVVVVNPRNDEIMAVTHDLRFKNPMHHAIMLAIDRVAESQLILKRKRTIFVAKKDVNHDDGIRRYSKTTIDLESKYACETANEKLTDKFDSCDTFTASVSTSDVTMAKTETLKNNKLCVDSLPYLCTGYDVYVTREPCIMCAMAMIHSRVRRVFYGCVSNNGALGTKCKIHLINQLNHHYLVFKNILVDECKSLEHYVRECK